ncbi:helix-turn-helix domain-containing protein [Luteimonas suaedae]|uniref:helix-turn-helix domain-containing protein n=1 Tax=Luteimonas suaedae TaxID=2605430 RepID=UPI0011ED66A9|nr:helix-turn-helix transcriptional regulator [Luteimonas suaedae]
MTLALTTGWQQSPERSSGQRLAEVRKAKGLSQESLALESGLSRSYLGGVERGQRNIALLKACESLESQPCLLAGAACRVKKK